MLSERQQKILAYIISHVDGKGFPPSIREIGQQVDISSTSVVKYNLNKLEDMNLLTRQKEVSRGISVNWQQLHEMNHVQVFDESILDDPALQEAIGKNSIGAAESASHFNGGSALPSNGHRHHLFPQSQEKGSYEGRLIRLPLLGRIAAGEPIAVHPTEQSNPEEWLDLAEGMFTPSRLGRPDSLYALRVQGDSMIDANVMDGDIVILRHQERAETGEMVAVWIEEDEETTLKYWGLQGHKVHLEPANPSYHTIVRDADKVRVQGSVVSVIRYLN